MKMPTTGKDKVALTGRWFYMKQCATISKSLRDYCLSIVFPADVGVLANINKFI